MGAYLGILDETVELALWASAERVEQTRVDVHGTDRWGETGAIGLEASKCRGGCGQCSTQFMNSLTIDAITAISHHHIDLSPIRNGNADGYTSQRKTSDQVRVGSAIFFDQTDRSSGSGGGDEGVVIRGN